MNDKDNNGGNLIDEIIEATLTASLSTATTNYTFTKADNVASGDFVNHIIGFTNLEVSPEDAHKMIESIERSESSGGIYLEGFDLEKGSIHFRVENPKKEIKIVDVKKAKEENKEEEEEKER